MLGKLLKYDFKNLFKVVIPMYGVGVLIALLARVMHFASDKISLLAIPSGFIMTMYVLTMIFIPIITMIITIMKFYSNICKDEGYLINTLPVTKNNIIMSKAISALCVIFISFLVSLILLFVGMYGNIITSNDLHEFIKLFSFVDNTFIILMILSIIIGQISNQLMFYTSITLGQKHNTHKVLYSIIYGIVIYNILQVVSSILIMIPMWIFEPNFIKYTNMDIPPWEFLNSFLILSLVMSAILTVIMFIISSKTLEKKLNLE